jgi:hypothetical protein
MTTRQKSLNSKDLPYLCCERFFYNSYFKDISYLTGTGNVVARHHEDDQKKNPDVNHVIVLETAHVTVHVIVAKINPSLKARKRRVRKKMKANQPRLRRKTAKKEMRGKWKERKRRIKKRRRMKV